MNVSLRYFWCIWAVIFLSCPIYCSERRGYSWLFNEEGEEGSKGSDEVPWMDLVPYSPYNPPPPAPPPPPPQPQQQGLYLQSANGGNQHQRPQMDPISAYGGGSSFQNGGAQPQNSAGKPLKQPRDKMNPWLFGGELTPEEEAENRREEAMVQETIEFNNRRKAEVELQQAEERRREEARRQEEGRRREEERRQEEGRRQEERRRQENERRLEEERRNAQFQQQMNPRDQELAVSRNRFEESQKNQQRHDPSLKGQPPSTNSRHSPRHEGLHRQRLQPEGSGDGNPPSQVIFKKTKGLFNQLIGSVSAINRISSYLLISCLIVSGLRQKC